MKAVAAGQAASNVSPSSCRAHPKASPKIFLLLVIALVSWKHKIQRTWAWMHKAFLAGMSAGGTSLNIMTNKQQKLLNVIQLE